MEGQPNDAPAQGIPPKKNKGLSVGFNLDLSVIHVYERSYSLDSSASDQDESKIWKKGDFLISLIALTVGFGNIFRFPFTAYRNGGGTFLIPYLIMHTLVGRPIYFLQLALGPGDDWGTLRSASAFNESVLGCNDTDLSAAFNVATGEKSSVSLAQLYFKNEVSSSQRAITLPNAWEGIKFFIIPDWTAMLNAKVWYAAVTQCLFSLNTGFGPLTMLGSHNKFDHNVYRDAWIVSGIDLFTSIFAGVTVFAVLGNLAGTLDVNIKEVTYAENELALIVFAQGVSSFTWLPQLFSIMFYLMLFVLGVVTATAYAGAVVAVISDQFPKITRFYAASCITMTGFVIGLIYVTPGGSVMVRLADYYGARMVIFLMTAAEVTGVAWIYGADKFLKDLEFMLGKKLGWYWKFCWCYFIPGGFTAILLSSLAQGLYAPLYKGEPIAGFSIILGWMFTFVAISALPIGAYHSVWSIRAGSFKKKFQEALKPSDDWGPQRSDLRREWIQFKEKTS
ncbi:unnamed protein product [Allacma fusca]|uniref:Sodium-dependent nutrient amino acid transporter 1 n=1 Tax=Allacma fusca TaxID=39272 RepID=A0A8J2JJ76_9HEXA|nr:unnamed protein product [Allacma fusca]